MSTRSVYDGTRRKLLLAFDVGTTYSGISYSILDPAQMPGIKGVTRFPAQETISGASKIPTIIYYDRKGIVRAVGAEATREGIFEEAEESGWVKAEWFKLHLRSKLGNAKEMSDNVAPLPPNKSVVDVFADFLRYLLECASSYIQDTQPDGLNLWNSLRDDIHFVLSHPNGWEGQEQSQMRQAAILAGLVPDTFVGHGRVSFVTEGEASLHYAIENGVLSEAMKGKGVVIVDAGGGTIDVSTYKRSSQENKRIFEEIAAPQCYFHGSVFVTFKAKEFLKDHLADSKFVDDLDHITSCFDKTTKPRFRNAQDPQYVKFGSTRDNDTTCDVRFGQLKIPGTTVAKFFQLSADCIAAAVLEQRKAADGNVSHVILVGGFAASDWLFETVRTTLSQKRLKVMRPENYVNKAVSDGAISFYLDHYVRARVAKVTYGNVVAAEYDMDDKEHVRRKATSFVYLDGSTKIPDVFVPILANNTKVAEATEFELDLVQIAARPSRFKALKSRIWCYRGLMKNPRWLTTDRGNYTLVCTLSADLSHLPKTSKKNSDGGIYYEVDYKVILLFGLTELQAQLSWIENGVERRSPAKVVYD